jgi:endogenous inhibitor of DNA gyrase (YacG/DUF329 family)
MTRTCTLCSQPIRDPARLRRSSPYCSAECKRQNGVGRRALLRAERCATCGRISRIRRKEKEQA